MNDLSITSEELYHWGIKGQKWGVRRFQNKDGSLTTAGKKRYSDESVGTKNDGKTSKHSKPKHYDKVYSKYKAEGYSDKEAERLTKGQLKTEKILATVGTVAVASLAAYGAYKFYDNRIDRIIKPGQGMQTVHFGDAADRLKAGNPFYATYTKRDNTIYASKVFSHFTDQSNVTRFYTNDGIKVASRHTGQKVFKDLLKNDPELKSFVESDKLLSKYKSNPKKLYDQFNRHLVLRGGDNDKMHGKFYEALKKRGYGAVIDINDSKLEGFTYNPVIVFDNQIKHITSSTQATSKELGTKRLAEARTWVRARKTLNKPLNNPTVVKATAIGMYSSAAMSVGAGNYIKQYKRKHPNTELTDFQISTMYMNQTKI